MRSARTGASLVGVLCAALISTASAISVPPHETDHDNTSQAFDWANIKPTRELKYHKCYGSFECTRLEVPLDWTNLSNPNTVAVAVARLPAVVDVSDESFGGIIVINPGGPSGSGVGILVAAGKSLQTVADSEKHFEILSFDPRGVQFTTPTLDCFQNGEVRTILGYLGLGSGSLESNQNALDTKWSIDKSLGLLCAQTHNGRFSDGSNIRQFVSTASVASDMVAIVDQVDAHRRKELSLSQLHLAPVQQVPLPAEQDEAETPLLNYWGLSYGTYLGNTFASMFPNRVGRMILDGVVDAPDYAAAGWTTNLQDNNKTWAKFFEYCYEAGDKCVLTDPSTRSQQDLQEKVEAFLADLQHNPLPLVVGGNAMVLTYFNMKSIIHALLYQPIQLWALLAQLLQSMMESNMDSTLVALQTMTAYTAPNARRDFGPILPSTLQHMPLLSGLPSSSEDETIPLLYAWHTEAAISILCGDSDAAITSRTKDDFLDYIDLLHSQSPLVGSIWAEITLPCIHWPARSRPASENRFIGPFRSNLSDYNPRGSPLLFIGNTADPVTPVRNAHKMAAEHEGAVVFTQDMPGHCAGAANPSVCTFAVVRAFFANGTLPQPGLVCGPMLKPWA